MGTQVVGIEEISTVNWIQAFYAKSQQEIPDHCRDAEVYIQGIKVGSLRYEKRKKIFEMRTNE